MGRLDLPDKHRDEDDDPVSSWRATIARGETTARCDEVIALEDGEIPARLLLALRGIRTQPPRRKAKAG